MRINVLIRCCRRSGPSLIVTYTHIYIKITRYKQPAVEGHGLCCCFVSIRFSLKLLLFQCFLLTSSVWCLPQSPKRTTKRTRTGMESRDPVSLWAGTPYARLLVRRARQLPAHFPPKVYRLAVHVGRNDDEG